MVLGVERFFLGGGDGRWGTDVGLVLGDPRGAAMRKSMRMKEQARTRFDARAAGRMIKEGLRAAQIGDRLGTDEMKVRRWAKRHKLGKKLEKNEGCVTRKATKKELSEAFGATPQRRRVAEPVAITPKVAGEKERGRLR